MNINEIKDVLKTILTEKRWQHSLGVAYSAKILAQLYGEEIEKVEIAAILHDCAKCLEKEQMENYIRKYKIPLDCVEKKEIELVHGRVGAYIAKYEYGVKDEEILSAITYHTTGKENMSKIEKIIYLADFIEPNRDYPNVDILRTIAYAGDLDKALLLSFVIIQLSM